MKQWSLRSLFTLILLTTCGCGQTLSNFWEETKTALHYVNHKGRSILGSDAESRLVANKQEFFGEKEDEFIPLSDQDIARERLDFSSPQSKEVPGIPGGKIPGISSFKNPEKALASLFCKVYFNTDQFVPNSKEALQNLHRIAAYLKKHPETYIFISGHCDERASEAYNLALGSKRANYIRNLLIKGGVNPSQLFTISYGKEMPAAIGHSEKTWAKNRRSEFKIYEKRATL